MKQLFVALAKELQLQPGLGLNAGTVHRDTRMKVRGSLFLAGEKAGLYFEALEKMISAASPLGTCSIDSFDLILSRRLAAALTGDTDGAISAEASLFVSELQSTPNNYVIKIAIFGLGLDCANLRFGRIAFSAEKQQSKFIHPDIRFGQDRELLFATVEVSAIDEDSAREKAATTVDRHLAILNAICSDYPPSSVRLSRSFSTGRDFTIDKVAVDGEEPTEHLVSNTGSRLVQSAEVDRVMNDHGGDLLSKLLCKDSSLALRITAAFETAGVACNEQQPHIAFLLFAIALESAVLGDRNKEEITHQLAIRVAHLLSASLSGRNQVFERVKSLYRVRSKIVHSGNKNVHQKDVAEVKYICLSALYALLSYEHVSKFEENDDLEDWFTSQLLDSQTIQIRD